MMNKNYWAVFHENKYAFQGNLGVIYFDRDFHPECLLSNYELAKNLCKCYDGAVLKKFSVQEQKEKD